MIRFETTWVTDRIQSDTIEWAKEFAETLLVKKPNGDLDEDKSLSTSQLRKFFGEIKRIQATNDFEKSKDDVLMLKPKLAYAKGRAKRDNKIHNLFTEMSKALNVIDYKDNKKGEKDFNNFIKIFEAVVAYHKASGGK